MTHVNVSNYRTPYFAPILLIFSYLQISLENLAFFTLKSPSVKDIKLSQKVYLKCRKNPSLDLRETIGYRLFFTEFENNFWFLK